MKKVISLISLCLVAVILVSSFSSCSNKKKFVGTWDEYDSEGNPTGTTLVLANDGTGSAKSDGISGSVTWSVEEDKLFLTLSMCGVTDTQEYTYKFSGDKLILIDEDGEETIYKKK